MALTTSKSLHLVDAATQTDSQSFTITHTLMDAAVSTEDLGVSEVTTGLQVDEGWKTLDGIHCIMRGITALVASIGGTLCRGTQTDFPWKTLPNKLARFGRTKGIHNLTLPHPVSLVNALKTGTLTIRAVTSDTAHTRLITSQDPIIIGEAPSHNSIHSHGRHAFANGAIDRIGLPHLAMLPLTPPTRRHVQVFVEISCPPPRPASRVHKAVPPSVEISHPPPQPASRVHKALLPYLVNDSQEGVYGWRLLQGRKLYARGPGGS
ncbi:hypothetical protein F4604DRAFT_1918025 [Suillus subluteus]|nr:hypothetical protein F4604DRAFT_1918025 [Suillus subluteus]